MQTLGDTAFVSLLRRAYEEDAHAGKLVFKNSFYLERGPYDIVSVLDENADAQPYVVNGPVIDLFDPALPVLASKTVNPGEQALLYDVSRVAGSSPRVLASASRIYDTRASAHGYSFVAKSPVNTLNSVRVLLPSEPAHILVTDHSGQTLTDVQSTWDAASHTEYLGFDNSPDGIKVDITW